MKIRVEKCSCGLMQNQSNTGKQLAKPEELISILESELEQRNAKLAAAIDRALQSSPVVRSIIQEIHDKDCDLVLVLTAKAASVRPSSGGLALNGKGGLQLELSSGDRSFLKSLRIDPD